MSLSQVKNHMTIVKIINTTTNGFFNHSTSVSTILGISHTISWKYHVGVFIPEKFIPDITGVVLSQDILLFYKF